MVRLLYPVPDDPPPTIRVEGVRFHHLIHVLRLRDGDPFELFDGHGRSFSARVATVDRTTADISVGPPVAASSERQIMLIQALTKADKMDWIIQKGTELGAGAFAPVLTARSVVKLLGSRAEKRVERWRKIAEEAARQCGRSDVPAVLPVDALEARVRAVLATTRCYVLDEKERSLSLAQAFSPAMADKSPVALIVGPEGGFERGEMETMSDLGAARVTLGKTRLRTETAAIVGLAVILHLDGRIG